MTPLIAWQVASLTRPIDCGGGAATKTFAPGGKHSRAATARMYRLYVLIAMHCNLTARDIMTVVLRLTPSDVSLWPWPEATKCRPWPWPWGCGLGLGLEALALNTS